MAVESRDKQDVRPPELDPRLQSVAGRIGAYTHADIGSDHGLLLRWLLLSARIQRGIAIENRWPPWENSRRALSGLNADVRLGDGLEVLKPGEAESLSMCGLGGQKMVRILQQHVERIPRRLVLQPNCQPETVRRWCYDHGWWLIGEQLSEGPIFYPILVFAKYTMEPDPAYDGMDVEPAWLFGPLLIRRRDPILWRQLRRELNHWERFERLERRGKQRRDAIRCLLSHVDGPP